jgi:predicted amidophosphoribosyltransferase
MSGAVDVRALAERAVDQMGDVFYDADMYSGETLACPECERDIPVLSESCPRCGAAFEEPLSKNRQIYEDAVACVAAAIRRALAAVEQGAGGVR